MGTRKVDWLEIDSSTRQLTARVSCLPFTSLASGGCVVCQLLFVALLGLGERKRAGKNEGRPVYPLTQTIHVQQDCYEVVLFLYRRPTSFEAPESCNFNPSRLSIVVKGK